MKKIFKTIMTITSLLLFTAFVHAQDCINYSEIQDNIGVESETFGISLGDFNGDGYKDVVCIHAYEDIEVYFNNGDGTFNTTTHHYGSTEHTRFGVQVLDVENDGDLDFVTTPFYSESVGLEIWKNDGNGNFTLGQTLASYSKGEELAVGDLNNDGYVDIFFPGAWNFHIFLNNQNGTFSSNGQDIETNYANAVALVDVDGDQDLDAIISYDNSLPGEVWTNDGQGHFTNSGQELTSETTDGVAAADMDGDGDMDVVFAPWMGDLELWENDGVGNFMPAGTIASSGFNIDVVFRDANFDGLPDIFVSYKMWLNDHDNPGHFIDNNVYYGSSCHDFEVGDVNNDNLLDIYVGAFSSSSGDMLYWQDEPTYVFADETICANDSAFLGHEWQTVSGNYYDYAGCDSVLITSLNVYDEINTGVTINGGTLTAMEDGAAYQWLDCADNFSPIVGEINQSFTPTVAGDYAVEITQNGMCVDTSGCYTSNYVGVASLNNEMFSIKPNPSSGIFALSFSSSIALKNIQIDIFDITGNVLYQMTKPQNTSTQIDISNQPKGVYFLQIKSDDMVETKRIILK
jgi:hypothetical protein